MLNKLKLPLLVMLLSVSATAMIFFIVYKSIQYIDDSFNIEAFTVGEENYIPARVWEVANANVVRISIGDNATGTCSGTIVNKEFLLTAAHCIPPFNAEGVTMTKEGIPIPFKLAANGIPLFPITGYGQIDAALVSGGFSAYNTISVDHFRGEVFKIKEAFLCGYPLFNNKLRCEKAQRVDNRIFAATFSTVSLPGQSGGAVFDAEGKLIGIIHSVTQDGVTQVASTTGIMSRLKR